MTTVKGHRPALCWCFAMALVVPLRAIAETEEEIEERLDAVTEEVERMKEKMGEAEARAAEESRGERDRANSKWHLAGYASTTFTATDEGGEDDTFALGSFNPVFHYQYRDFALFEGEFEFEIDDDGETETNLEYAALNLLLHDYVTLVTGAFLSPIGQFQERLHPAWINKLPAAPAGFGHGGIQPLSDVGVQLRGGIPVGKSLATYSVYGGNGPQLGEHGLEFEAFGKDDNRNKAAGGRLGFLPVPWLEVGGSFLVSNVDGAAGTEADLRLFGGDAAITSGPWDVRFEYLYASLNSLLRESEAGPPGTFERVRGTHWEAYYVQAAYQLSGMTDMRFIRNLEPVVRYGKFDVEGFVEFDENGEERAEFGLNYLFAPSLIGKLAGSWRNFDRRDRDDHMLFQMELAYGF